jgi:YggT family protein
MTLLIINIVSLVFSVIKFILIASIVMSWLVSFGIVSPGNPNVRQTIFMLDRFTRPILGPIQRIVPPFNGLDFSPLIAFLLLDYVIQPFVFQLLAGALR